MWFSLTYHFVIFTFKWVNFHSKNEQKRDWPHVEIRILVQSNVIHPSSFSKQFRIANSHRSFISLPVAFSVPKTALQLMNLTFTLPYWGGLLLSGPKLKVGIFFQMLLMVGFLFKWMKLISLWSFNDWRSRFQLKL